MRKILLITFLLIFCITLTSKPVISFQQTEYDFGKIKEEEGPHTKKIIFNNTGDQPFKILKVSAG